MTNTPANYPTVKELLILLTNHSDMIGLGFFESLNLFRREMLTASLDRHIGDVREASTELGIQRELFRYHLPDSKYILTTHEKRQAAIVEAADKLAAMRKPLGSVKGITREEAARRKTGTTVLPDW